MTHHSQVLKNHYLVVAHTGSIPIENRHGSIVSKRYIPTRIRKRWRPGHTRPETLAERVSSRMRPSAHRCSQTFKNLLACSGTPEQTDPFGLRTLDKGTPFRFHTRQFPACVRQHVHANPAEIRLVAD